MNAIRVMLAIVSLPISILVTCLACEPPTSQELVSPKFNTTTPDLASKASSQAWQLLPDKTREDVLDQFICSFPNSTEALTAFSLRQSMVRKSRNKKQYHAFIQRYSNRMASIVALQELYLIYAEEKGDSKANLNAYLEFARVYPGTIQADLAYRRAQYIACEMIRSKDGTYKQCIAFLAAFPNSPFFEIVNEAAKKLRAIEVKRDIEKPGTEKPSQRAQALLGKYQAEITDYNGEMTSLAGAGGANVTDASYKALAADQDKLNKLNLARFRFEHLDYALTSDSGNKLFFQNNATAQYGTVSGSIISVRNFLGISTILKYIIKQNEDTHQLIIDQFIESRAFIESRFVQLSNKVQGEFDDMKLKLNTITARIDELKVITETGFKEVNGKLDKITSTLTEMNNNIKNIQETLAKELPLIKDKLDTINGKVDQVIASQAEIKCMLEDQNNQPFWKNLIGFLPLPPGVKSIVSRAAEGVIDAGQSAVQNAVDTVSDLVSF